MKPKPSRHPRPSFHRTPWLGLAPWLGLDLRGPLAWPWLAPELPPDWPVRLALALAFGAFWLALAQLRPLRPRGRPR